MKKEVRVRCKADPVPECRWASLALCVAVVVATYGTYWMAHNVLPKGARGAGRGAMAVSFNNKTGGADAAPNASTTTTISDIAVAYLAEEDLGSVRDYIGGAIPWFVVLMVTEFILIKLSGLKSQAAQYTALDTWSSLSAGITQTLMALVLRRLSPHLMMQVYLYRRYGVEGVFGDHTTSWLPYVVGFVLNDFTYYLFHRYAHENSIFWAGHNLHHSSEHYNLSTALRQSFIQNLTGHFWRLPLALFTPPAVALVCDQWVTLYQFWIHTCVIRRMPWWFEAVMVSPSHHRIHHDRRLHKNFAGVFIVWDKMFGTFHDEIADAYLLVGEDSNEPRENFKESNEEEICLFGHTDQCETWAEAPSQMQWHWKHTLNWAHWRKQMSSRRWLVPPLRVFLWGPGYAVSNKQRQVPAVAAPGVQRLRMPEYLSRPAKLYFYAATMWNVAATFVLLQRLPKLTETAATVSCLMIVCGQIVQGLIADGKRLGVVALLEMARCFVLLVVVGELFCFRHAYFVETQVLMTACVVVLSSFFARN